MATVASLGSVNVDLIQYLPRGKIDAFADEYDWFPANGATVRIADVPDAVFETEPETFVGGKGANQAVAAASGGAEARLLGGVGADAREYDVLSTLADRGVRTDAVAERDCQTGKAYIFVDGNGESWIAIVGGANETVDETYVDRHYDTIRGSDVLLLQNEIPAGTAESLLSRLAGEPDRPTVILNPAPVDGAGSLIEAPAVDLVVVNRSEYAALADDLGGFEGTVVQTRGGDDVLVEGAVNCRVTPPEVDPVDTTGAGDAFCGVLAARLADGRPVESAVETATVAASNATEIKGAQAAMAELDAVASRPTTS